MKKEGYNFIDYQEDKHWWFIVRCNIFFNLIKNLNNNINNFLDIGCGTGNFMKKISPISKNVYGIDPHTYKNSKHKNILKGEAEDIPFKNNMFDFISCFDVLEHLKQPNIVIDEIHRILKRNGYAIITTPACQNLYGPHDVENEHIKRYSKKELEKLFDDRFEIIRSTYFNTLLFPIEGTTRLIEKILNKKIKKNEIPNNKLNNFFLNIFNKEVKFLENKNFPIGMSCLIIVRKK